MSPTAVFYGWEPPMKIAKLISHLSGLLRIGIPVSSGSGNAGSIYFRHSTRTVGLLAFKHALPPNIMPLLRTTRLTGGGAIIGEHRIHRWVVDSDQHLFGYDLSFDAADGTAAQRLVFSPLSLKPSQLTPLESRRRQLPVDRLPSPQALRLGRSLEFSLSTADGRYKVIERINFS